MMKTAIYQKQDGTVTIFAIVCIAILLSFSTAIFLFSRVEQQTQQRFLLGWTVKRAAQDGIQAAQAMLNEQPEASTQILQGKGKVIDLCSFTSRNSQIKVSVQAKSKAGDILVLSIAREQNISRRSIAYFKKIGSGAYEISHWEN